MKARSLVLGAASVLGGALACCGGSSDSLTESSREITRTPLALVGGTLLDSRGGQPLGNATLLTRGELIEAVGPSASVAVPADARVVDVSGCFVLPGFVNAHVHNTIGNSNLRTWALAGVTTVRDVGASQPASVVFAFRAQAAQDPANARLLAAGPLVTVPGGYPIAGNNFPSLTVLSPEDARAKITALANEGADLIKISLEPGGSNWPVLSEEEVRAIIETAHGRGLPVTAHVTRASLLEMAVEAGLDDAAHVPTDTISDALIARMVERGVGLVPTLAALGRGGDNVRRLAAAGGLVALGNDGGYLSGLELGMPLRELRLLAANGLTPSQVIVAATRNAARVCRRESLLGTLEPGKAADVLVVRGDPLADLEALRAVRLVVHGGVVIREER